MRKKHGVAVMATVLVAGLATFLPGVIGGQGAQAVPAHARLMSKSTISGVPQGSRAAAVFVPEAAAGHPAVQAVGAFFFTYVTGKVVDYVLKATKKIITAGEDAEESSSAADAEEALAFIGAQPRRHQLEQLFPTGDSQFNAGG
jgi:hypothetical protein